MKKILLLLYLSVATNVMAQNDTLYFDAHWQKTSKDSAVFYRPIPLKKVGDLYAVKDYYENGNLQMEGFWSDVKNEVLHGKSIWYYENGNIREEQKIVHDTLHGISTRHSIEGFLRAKGEYKMGMYWSGTFMDRCCNNGGTTEYDKGIKKAGYRYYKGTNQVAEKTIYDNNKKVTSMVFYDRTAKIIGEVSIKYYMQQVDGKMCWFHADDDGITTMSGYAHYKNEKEEGEEAEFDEQGNLIAKGINKDGAPYSGTHMSPNGHLYTYVEGKFEGVEIAYSEKGNIIARGINKNGAHWEGHFNEWNLYISNYKNGQLEGKQVVYHTKNFEKTSDYYFISKGKKEGKSVAFDKEGKEIASGIYRNNEPWQGTFYDDYYKKISSYKEGKKHGMFINYTTKGRILSQQEYVNGEIGGVVKSTGYFENRICECQYEHGRPFEGEVCEEDYVIQYKNGLVVKRTEFDGEKLDQIKSIRQYDKGKQIKKSVYHEGKVYELIYKDQEPYEGTDYQPHYGGELTTYTNGKKNGVFSVFKIYSGVFIEGNFKDNLWEGKISFTNEMNGNKTSCIYKKGVPISGIAMLKDKTITYAKGIKNGMETSKEMLYDNYQVVYDSISRNYVNGKLEGNIGYFKEGKQIVSGVYKGDKPFRGTFYQKKSHKYIYEDGKLITSIYKFRAVTVESSYVNNQIVEEKMIVGSGIDAVGTFKNGLPFDGRFVTFDDKENPKVITYTNYNKGKKNGALEVFDVFDKKITKKMEYKNDKPRTEIWLIPFKGENEVVGNYKKGKPFSGYFYSRDDIIEILSQYKNGIKSGYTYYAVTGSHMESVLDSIHYINGKPFDGGELERLEDNTHQHIYEKGQLVKTNIYHWGLVEVPEVEIIYIDNGFITNMYKGEFAVQKTLDNVVKEKINQVTFSNTDRTAGSVVFYSIEEEIGRFAFANGKIETIDLTIVKNGIEAKVYKKEPDTILLEVRNKEELIIFHPDIKLPQRLDYIYFTDFVRLLSESNGTVFYYLDNTKKNYSSCTIKKGEPYHGIVIRRHEKNNYIYREYREGKEYKEVEKLTKKELLKLLEK